MRMLKSLLTGLWRSPAAAARAAREKQAVASLGPAIAAFNASRYEEVIRACESVISEQPDSAQARHLCARALMALNRYTEAEGLLKAALEVDPDLADAHADLATIRFEAGDHEAAEKHARDAVAAQPTEARFRAVLADVLQATGRDRDALTELFAALEFAPERQDLLLRLCSGLDRVGRHREMLPLAQRAIAENGENFETLCCLALAQFGVDELEAAVATSRKALQLYTDDSAPYVVLGNALFDLGKPEEALAAHRRALKLEPDSVAARYDISLINLMRWRFREGWVDFEQRLNINRFKAWRSCEPRWNGTALNGRTILVMREQGLGDEIMYASCYPDLLRQSAQCHIECEPRLERLFARSFPGARFHPLHDMETRERTDPGVPVDVYSYAGSLPRHFRSGLREFPAHDGYLKADPARVQYWRGQLAALGQGLKVGISWRGGVVVTRRARRSLDLTQLLPLLTVPGVRWVNLQYGDRVGEIEDLTAAQGIVISDWPEAIDGDYDETASLVSALDLVISVCTSVVHLTGALGRPAWVMTPRIPEWRYGLERGTMPWYPSVRLFRQPVRGVWSPVIADIREQLVVKTSGRG
ncbi:MAG: tetratricopeptide repeat protein [Burkholderiales bacterium]|jgi:tetratricopeptide (TPR) repeat protein|nr:tetratricopeptide repeat protein [Burkholderiales bacterium]